MNILKLSALTFVMVPFVAFADAAPKTDTAPKAEKTQGSGPNPYVECGIGAALFPTTNWAAVTSNAIWDLGSTAITSAISSPETCSAKKMKTAKLILETLPELEKDVAAGEGKYITALLATAGCDASSKGAITANMRSSYATMVSAGDYADKSRIDRAASFYSSTKDAMTAANCNVVL
jgi:hypothetical protein